MARKVFSTFSKLIIFGLVSLSAFAPFSNLDAQTFKSVVAEQLPEQLSEKEINQLTEELADSIGIPASSKFRERLFNPSLEAVHPLLAATEGVPQTIYKHFRAKKGIPFSVPANALDIDALVAQMTEVDPEIRDILSEAENEYVAINTKIPKLKRCEFDITDKVDSADPPKPGEVNNVFFDVLYMRQKDIPLDPEVAIGRTTFIIPFSPTQLSLGAIIYNAGVVPCFPYRVRMTAKGLYKDQGLNALKNYDKNPNGSGELTETMAKILAEGRRYEN